MIDSTINDILTCLFYRKLDKKPHTNDL